MRDNALFSAVVEVRGITEREVRVRVPATNREAVLSLAVADVEPRGDGCADLTMPMVLAAEAGLA